MKILTILLLFASITASAQQAKQKETVKLPDYTRFEKTRSTGKIIQLLGVAGLFTYAVMNNKYNGKIDRGDRTASRPSGVIPIVSTGAIGVGLAIDISAGRHLRK